MAPGPQWVINPISPRSLELIIFCGQILLVDGQFHGLLLFRLFCPQRGCGNPINQALDNNIGFGAIPIDIAANHPHCLASTVD